MDKKEYLERVSKNILRYRKIAGMNQAQLAQEAGLSRITCVNIENGKVEPKTSNLQSIADALKVSIFELFKEQPKFVSLRFRSNSKKAMESKARNLREQTLIEFRSWLDNYRFLEEQLNDHAKFSLAKLVGAVGVSPVEMAAKARSILKLGNQPISDICGLVENIGVKVWIAKPKTQAFSGFSISEKGGGPAIAVNGSLSTIERKIFTVAHELGHILLHPESYCSQDELDVKDDASAEKAANLFAGHFLMPEEAFNKEWGNNGGISFVDRVLKVKRYFNVSYETVLYRLIQKHPDKKDILFPKFRAEFNREKAHDLKNHYEPDSLCAGFKGSEPESSLSDLDFMEERFKKLVRQAFFEKELVTASKAAEMLGISLSEIRALGVSWRETP